MARHLLMDNPVQYWPRSGEDLEEGFLYRGGIWVSGQGYWTGACTADRKSEAIGLLQWDGVFCPVLPGNQYGFYGGKAHLPLEEAGRVALISGNYYYTYLKGFDPYYHVLENEWNQPNGLDSATIAKSGAAYNVFQIKEDGTIGARAPWGSTHNPVTIPLDPLPPGQPTVSHKVDQQWYVIYSNGQGFIYDFDANEIVNAGIYIDDHSRYWLATTTYCKDYDIFFTVTRDFIDGETVRWWDDYDTIFRDRPTRLKVYANEGVPAAFSPIVMTPDPCPTGQVATLSVNLLGAQGEPVEDHLIDWSIVEGEGVLVNTQSKTNYLGESTVQFVPPEDPISTRFKVEVTY